MNCIEKKISNTVLNKAVTIGLQNFCSQFGKIADKYLKNKKKSTKTLTRLKKKELVDECRMSAGC
jgi:hypothetical protein